ncbi:hypothetical protein THRCLA_09168 [Thraustotheca clavata]|uniref:Uncharacterized protein n=1 Tax=Thraustotheca clavata TaxID=74557 RepID=A0A1V9YZ02_9STRA|nr:hypothetical protein THRCLA_09168 [Thraustotheca clavata]
MARYERSVEGRTKSTKKTVVGTGDIEGDSITSSVSKQTKPHLLKPGFLTDDVHCVTRPVSPTVIARGHRLRKRQFTMSLSPIPKRRHSTSDCPDDDMKTTTNPEDCPELTVMPNEAYNRLLKQYEAVTEALSDAHHELELKDAMIETLENTVNKLELDLKHSKSTVDEQLEQLNKQSIEIQQLQAKYQCESKLRTQILIEHTKLQGRWQDAHVKAMELDNVQTELREQEKRFQELIDREKRVSRIELKAAHAKINSLHQTILEMEYESVRQEQTKYDGGISTQSAQSRHIQQELQGLQRQRCVSQSKWLFEGSEEDHESEAVPPRTPRTRTQNYKEEKQVKPKKRDEVNYLFDIAEQLLIFSKDSHLNALTTLEMYEETMEKSTFESSSTGKATDSFDIAACVAIADEAEALLKEQYLFQLP